MLKNKILKIGLIALLIILLVLIITFIQIYFQEKKASLPGEDYSSNNRAVYLEDPNIKMIRVEILSEEERVAEGFGSRLADPADIQVISRGEDGKLLSYRKIYSPSDIVNALYDPTGERTAGMRIEYKD